MNFWLLARVTIHRYVVGISGRAGLQARVAPASQEVGDSSHCMGSGSNRPVNSRGSDAALKRRSTVFAWLRLAGLSFYKPILAALLPALLIFSTVAMSQTTAASQTSASTSHSSADYDALINDYFDKYFPFHPTEGTADGFHQYDEMLESYSQTARDAEIAFLADQKQRFNAFPAGGLSEDQRADLKMVSNSIDARLLELQEIRNWQRNPDGYSSGPTYSIFILMSRNFAAPEQRLKSVIAREQKMPANFAAAQVNLKDVPKIYTEIALLQSVRASSASSRTMCPAAFKSVTDAKLLAEFKASNDKVIAELQAYQDFLKNDLLPVSNGDFALGAEKYRKKLHYDEMVDIPLDRLLQIGYDDLHKNQAELKRVAAQIDPSKTPEQILEQLEQDHPQPDQLLQSFRDTFNGLVDFIQQKQVITLPSPTCGRSWKRRRPSDAR